MGRLSRVLFLMLCHFTSLAKQLVFHGDADNIDRLIAGLDDVLYNQSEKHHRALLSATSKSSARLLQLYSGCAVSTCVLWTLFPILDLLQGRDAEFFFWMPIDCNDNVFQFVLVLTYAFYSTTVVAVANTTMDAFIATVLYQCTTQLKILRTCQLLEQIFGAALLVQFGVGGWILCMAAYQIVSMEVLSIEFASTTLFIGCILTELFLYCYYGNEVTVQSGLVSESLYGMQWLWLANSERRALMVVLERARRPLRPAALHVVPLTLNTYLKILKSSYSFYAVLRQTK